jgi:hypothetical protein
MDRAASEHIALTPRDLEVASTLGEALAVAEMANCARERGYAELYEWLLNSAPLAAAQLLHVFFMSKKAAQEQLQRQIEKLIHENAQAATASWPANETFQ